MRKFLNFVLWVPLGVIIVIFAVANRHLVTVSFDPFNSSDPSLGLTLPLFVVIIAMAMLGVAVGGSATWIRQRHWRRAARLHEADARQARTELADLRSASTSAPRQHPRPLAAPVHGWAGGRDKRGATL